MKKTVTRVVERQSGLDGLCGIFCLVNAVQNWTEKPFFEESRDCFRYLFEVADRLRLFSVHRVTGGFEAHEMVDIFNEFARAHRFPGQAFHLPAVADRPENWSLEAQVESIFKVGGQIVTPVDEGRHFVLAYAYNPKKGLLVDDPDPGKPRASVKLKSVHEECREGVLLDPSGLSFK